MTSIGVISDTHGLLRPEALDAVKGSDLIVHAGDIGSLEVIDQLAAIAPTHAVRGNIDKKSWAQDFSEDEFVEVGAALVYVLHNLEELAIDPRAAGVRVVISGHSHKPSISREEGVLYLNPGSAGPRRFHLPVAVARLRLDSSGAVAEIIELDS